MKSVAEKYYDYFKGKVPEDLDAFLEKQILENWKIREKKIEKLNGASSGI
ncbi:MAG: hypothetical protein V1710_10250 [Candidatus Bathyarchaeota archaeon]